MRLTLMGVALLLSIGSARAAPDGKPDKKDLSPAQEVERLIADYAKAQQDFQERYGKAKTDAERNKLVNESMPKPGPVAARLLELADKAPMPAAADGAEPKIFSRKSLKICRNCLDESWHHEVTVLSAGPHRAWPEDGSIHRNRR
jgi:hypothetical protein